jgi:hypothetical protein
MSSLEEFHNFMKFDISNILHFMKKAPEVETYHNNIKFEDRLYARWAIFFENMNIKYQYKPTCVYTDNGGSFKSTFLLPELKIYVEIKMTKDEIDIDDIWRWHSFAIQYGNELLLIIGAPGKEEMMIIDRRTVPPIEEIKYYRKKEERIIKYFLKNAKEWGTVGFEAFPGNANYPNPIIVFKKVHNNFYKMHRAISKAQEKRFISFNEN